MTSGKYYGGRAAALAVAILTLTGCSMSSFKPAPGPASLALAQFAEPTAPEAAAIEGGVPAAQAVPEAPAVMAYTGSNLDPLITHYAAQYEVPEALVRRVIQRESNYNPAARNGPYYGLMQISHATATTMGYRGAPSGLLDAETNLRYAVRYLAGAYMTAGGNPDQAVRFYARGYYYDAKRAGLLEKAGLR